MQRLYAGLCLHPAALDRLLEHFVVALVLVRTRLREHRERAVERIARAQVAGDCDRISRACVRASELGPHTLAYIVICCGSIVSTMADPFASQSWRT